MARLVSDEVWTRLDANAGRLSRRATRRVWIFGGLAVIAVVAFVAIWRSGAIVPRLSIGDEGGFGYSELRGGPIHFEFTIANAGRLPVTVVGAGRGGPGLELVRVDGDFPIELDPRESTTFVLHYRVTDCSATVTDPWPPPVRVRRLSWTQTVQPVEWPNMLLPSVGEIADVQCGRVTRR